jgi:hypothetical protein
MRSGIAENSPPLGILWIGSTAAVSSIPYTPRQSMRAIRRWFTDMGGKLWDPYGFYDAFSVEKDWYPRWYLAIRQNIANKNWQRLFGVMIGAEKGLVS